MLLLGVLLIVFKGLYRKANIPNQSEAQVLPDAEIASAFGRDPGKLTQIAECYAELLCNGASWVDRRKEAVTVIDDTTLRRFGSIDIALSDTLEFSERNGNSEYLLPVMLLEKAPGMFTSFDVRDETRTALPLPTRDENAAVSAAVLIAAAEAIESGIAAVGTHVRQSLINIAYWPRDPAAEKVDQMCEPSGPWVDARWRKVVGDPNFVWLLETIAGSLLVVIPICTSSSHSPARKIIKIGFNQGIGNIAYSSRNKGYPRIGWRGIELLIVSFFVGARSYHFEAHVPAGLQITKAKVIVDQGQGPPKQTSSESHSSQVHLYVPEASDFRSAVANISIRVRRDGFITNAAVTGLIVTGLLGGFVAFAGPVGRNPSSSATSLLLLLPTLVAGMILTEASNKLAGRLLSFARFVLFVVGLAPLVAASRLVLGPQSAGPGAAVVSASSLRWWWVPCLAVAAMGTASLLLTALLPRPTAGD